MTFNAARAPAFRPGLCTAETESCGGMLEVYHIVRRCARGARKSFFGVTRFPYFKVPPVGRGTHQPLKLRETCLLLGRNVFGSTLPCAKHLRAVGGERLSDSRKPFRGSRPWPARFGKRFALCGAFPCLWCAHGARTAKLLCTCQRRSQ